MVNNLQSLTLVDTESFICSFGDTNTSESQLKVLFHSNSIGFLLQKHIQTESFRRMLKGKFCRNSVPKYLPSSIQQELNRKYLLKPGPENISISENTDSTTEEDELIRETEQAIQAAFLFHTTKNRKVIAQSYYEPDWDQQKSIIMLKIKDDLKSVPRGCWNSQDSSSCERCQRAVHAMETLYDLVKGKSNEWETESKIESCIADRRKCCNCLMDLKANTKK